jgi:3-deoxy-D-manno-octulosonic-acid transferase
LFRFLYIYNNWILSLFVPFVSILSSKIAIFFRLRDRAIPVKQGQVKYWVHAASLGEYEMALPLIEKLLETHQKEDILITIFSPSGYGEAVKGDYADRVMYLPIDTYGRVKRFYKEYAPQKALFVRYDFWYNFIYEGQKQGTEFYLVNGRFQKNHFFFKWYGTPYLSLLKKFQGIFTSDEKSSKLLIAKGIKNVIYTGDTRYDRVTAITQSAKPFEVISAYKGSRNLLILGSSWEEEEDLVKILLKVAPQNLAVIIAPHDLSRTDKILEVFRDFKPKRYTDNKFSVTDQLLILDTMGMLSSMYQYADLALIGGGFSGALHNILEPAVWGCHLSFGPHVSKFPEANEFVEAGFAYSIVKDSEWIDIMQDLCSDKSKLESSKAKAKMFTAANIGATSRIVSSIQ